MSDRNLYFDEDGDFFTLSKEDGQNYLDAQEVSSLFYDLQTQLAEKQADFQHVFEESKKKDKEIERLNSFIKDYTGVAKEAYHEGWNDNRDNFGNSGNSFFGSDTRFILDELALKLTEEAR